VDESFALQVAGANRRWRCRFPMHRDSRHESAVAQLFSLGGFDIMSIYWSLKNVPELAPLTRKQRRQVHEQCLQRYFFRAPATARSISAFLAALFTAIVFLIFGVSIPELFGVPHNRWFLPIFGMIGFVFGRFILSRIAIPVLRPFYHEFIKRDREPAA